MSNQSVRTSSHHLTVTARDELDVLIVAIVGKADAPTESLLCRALRAAVLEPCAVVVIDLSALDPCSPGAMRIIAEVIRSTRQKGVPVALVGLDPVSNTAWPIADVPIPIQFVSVERAIEAFAPPASAGRESADIAPIVTAGRMLSNLNGMRQRASRAVVERLSDALTEHLAGTSDKAFGDLLKRAQDVHRVRKDSDNAGLASVTNIAVAAGRLHLVGTAVGRSTGSPGDTTPPSDA